AQLAAALGLHAPALEACPVGVLERVVEIAGGIAAVVGGAGGRLVGKRFLRDEVAPAKLDAVDAGFARRLVDEPLQQIGNVRPPRAPVGSARRGVGEPEPMPA